MDLVPLLVAAQDKDNAEFKRSQEVLNRMGEEDPVNFIGSLLEVLSHTDAPPQALFLALVLLYHNFQHQIIEYSKEHRFLESRLDPALNVRLLDVAFSYFVHTYAPIRNMAVRLFCSVAATQTQRPELALKEKLLQTMLQPPSVEAVLSSIEAIHNLWFFYRYDYTEQDQAVIIGALFRILEPKDGNEELMLACLKMLQNLVSLLSQLFVDKQEYLRFVNRILEFLEKDSMRGSLYQLLSEIVGLEPLMVVPMVEKVLAASLSDLERMPNRDCVLSCIWFWESVVSLKQPAEEVKAALGAAVSQLIPRLLVVMGHVSTDSVLDYAEMEPYSEAQKCIALFFAWLPDVAVPLLVQFIAAESGSENARAREVVLKALRILEMRGLDSLPIESETVLQMIMAGMADAAPRVRNAAVLCLHMLVKKSGCPGLDKFIQPLLALTADVEATGMAALGVVRMITMKGYANYPELFRWLMELVPRWTPAVREAGIVCFAVPPTAEISSDVANNVLAFLCELLKQLMQGQRGQCIGQIMSLCMAMCSIIKKTDARIAPLAEGICSAMACCYEQLGLGCSLPVIAALATPIPELLQQQLPQFLPLVMRGLKQFHDPEGLVSSVMVVPQIFTSVDAKGRDLLIKSLASAFIKGTSARAKTEVLKVFLTLIGSAPTETPSISQYAFVRMRFVVLQLEQAAEHYGEQLSDLIGVIIDLIKAITTKWKQTNQENLPHMFELANSLVKSALSSTTVQQYCIIPIISLMAFLLEQFPDLARASFAEIPNLLETISSTLRDQNCPEDEIARYISMLQCG